MPNELLADVDAYCKSHKYNRSEFIRSAIRLFIQEKRKVSLEEVQNEYLD